MQALRDLDAAGIGVQDVGLRRPTLDDVFLTLTGHDTAEEAEAQLNGTNHSGGKRRRTESNEEVVA